MHFVYVNLQGAGSSEIGDIAVKISQANSELHSATLFMLIYGRKILFNQIQFI